jgi:hypothetical protein
MGLPTCDWVGDFGFDRCVWDLILIKIIIEKDITKDKIDSKSKKL